MANFWLFHKISSNFHIRKKTGEFGNLDPALPNPTIKTVPVSSGGNIVILIIIIGFAGVVKVLVVNSNTDNTECPIIVVVMIRGNNNTIFNDDKLINTK